MKQPPAAEAAVAASAYVILLRGINVGGKNKVPMAALKACLEALGCERVTTYIASGNVMLRSAKTAVALTAEIEKALPARFELDDALIRVLVLSHEELRAVVKRAPKGFGAEPGKSHSDAIFLIGITPDEAFAAFDPREGVDRLWRGELVIYSQRLSAMRTKSRLSKAMSSPLYKQMTIRSWETTAKLLELMDGA
jgi:uncharacterized protein (DUF1697 family)